MSSVNDVGEEDDESRVLEAEPTYRKGAMARDIRAQLKIIVMAHLEGRDRDETVGFLDWCPDADLEGFLARALEYAKDKTKPRLKKGG